MSNWQLQQAKQKLSKVVDDAISSGPQIITRHGEEAAVVISVADYRRLKARQPTFKQWLLEGPKVDRALKISRRKELPRDPDNRSR